MLMYEKIFSEHDFQTAQVLITHNDINDRVRYLNIKGTLEELLNNGVIPIINENDVVSTEEIKFGDNDNLASMIANLVDADLLIILTDQKGMYDKNPDSYKDAKLINRIKIEDLKSLILTLVLIVRLVLEDLSLKYKQLNELIYQIHTQS